MGPARWSVWWRQGTVSVEVALLFPVAILVLVGFAEMYFYVRTVAIVERVAATVADTVSKRASLSDCQDQTSSSYLGAHMWVAETTAQPLDLAANGQVIVSAVADVNGTSRIVWQRRSAFTQNQVSTVGSEGGTPTLPSGLTVKATAGSSIDVLVVAEVFYSFKPFAGTRSFLPDLPTQVSVSRRAFARARAGSLDSLPLVGGCAALSTP